MCWLDTSLLQISPSAWGSRNLGADRFGPHFCWLPSPEKDWTAPLDLILLKSLETNMIGLSSIQSSHPLSSPSPPTFNLSQHQGLFKWVSSSHQAAKVLEFQLQHQSFQWYSGLISFRIDFLNLLAVWGTLKSLLQHQSSKASILRCSAFFIVQLSHPYMTTRKTIALTRWTFVDKVMSLLLNMLSRLVITVLPRSKQVSFNFMAAITICSAFGAPQNKVCHCFHCFPICLLWSDGTGSHNLSFLNLEC